MTHIDLDAIQRIVLPVLILLPIAASAMVGLLIMASSRYPSERTATRILEVALTISLVLSALVAMCATGVFGAAPSTVVDYGALLELGTYRIPAVLLADWKGVVFSLLCAFLTLLVARFSRTYMHREAGYFRFFILLGGFATGAQLVALAGALDIFFAGWELIGIGSALFIGFFHERAEPVRSSLRAFATYRLCDAGFLMAMVCAHEVLGSTTINTLDGSIDLPLWESTTIGLLFLLSVMGKSAQLPFSGWLPRAMEGPTPTSALFYGGISLHAGLFLMLRISPIISASPVVQVVGAVIGISTAIYAAAVARTNPDAKGALAHATLCQVGLILAEISLGFTTLALVHISGHALLRVWQYLRAPNAIHDAHRIGVHAVPAEESQTQSVLERRVYAAALHRLRLDDRIDSILDPFMLIARALDKFDQRVRVLFGGGKERDP
jgi:NADH:ubiquinone oxidoreductase subunit 5 (subunit L)/multisubunit Na+/H+ antiporter MnhA subunit